MSPTEIQAVLMTLKPAKLCSNLQQEDIQKVRPQISHQVLDGEDIPMGDTKTVITSFLYSIVEGNVCSQIFQIECRTRRFTSLR